MKNIVIFFTVALSFFSVRAMTSGPLVTGCGVGGVLIGKAPPRDGVMIERRRWMLDENGKPYEDLTINMGASEINAELYDGKVWRIWIDSVGLYTHDGVSVGSNALSVLRRNPTISVEIGPGPSMVLIPKKPCGISYVVGIELPEDVPPVMTRRQAEVMLGESKIAKLIVVGCGEEVHSSI